MQAVQLVQSCQLQSTGQGFCPQGCSSDAFPMQSVPPFEASVSTVRFLMAVPPPQLALQGPVGPQRSQTQSTGHGWGLHEVVSVAAPTQFCPPFEGNVCTLRVLVVVPPAQDLEHGSWAPQGLQEQSTGQAWVLHADVSIDEPTQAAPPKAAAVRTALTLVARPPPQDAEQLPKEPQLSQTQFTAQACALQLCVSVGPPTHPAPPLAA